MKRIVVGMHEAKTTLSQLVKRALGGEDVVIANNGVPVARIVPYATSSEPPRVPGQFAGQIEIKPGFDDLPPGFEVFAE